MSQVKNYVYLDTSELVPDRPFTNPEHNPDDLAMLEYMAKRLRYVLNQPDAVRHYPRPFVLYLPESGGLRLRLAITNPDGLLSNKDDLLVVGFCGQKRPEAERSQVEAVDIELVSEFLQHPYLLSYCSLELKCGNWCNLVLFSHSVGLRHWATSRRHAYAALELAPNYYLSIRLHNGQLPGGLMSGHKIRLTRTKYFDYRGETIWRALRELRPVEQPSRYSPTRLLLSLVQKVRYYMVRGVSAS